MRYTLVHGFCFFKLFPIGCIGLKRGSTVNAAVDSRVPECEK